MLQLRHFQADYTALCEVGMNDDTIAEVVHSLINEHYSYIAKQCYEWLYSDRRH